MMIVLSVILTLCCMCSVIDAEAATVASALTVTGPTPINEITYVAEMETTITFDLTLTPDVDDGGVETTAVTAYFANADSSVMSNPKTATGTTTAAADATSMTGIIAELELPSEDCTGYTRVCAKLTGPESETCFDFGDTVGYRYCYAFVKTNDFTITAPDPASEITYSTDAATTITFNLMLTEYAGLVGSLTGIDLYFTDNAEYESADKKSSAMAAVHADFPLDITAADNTTATGVTAELTLDAANCDSYTYLCALAKLENNSGEGNDDVDSCIPLTDTATGAGDTTCPNAGNGIHKGSAITALIMAVVVMASMLM